MLNVIKKIWFSLLVSFKITRFRTELQNQNFIRTEQTNHVNIESPERFCKVNIQ